MTGQTPPRTAAFTATVRVHLLHAPDPDTEPNPDLEAAAIRDGLVFALPRTRETPLPPASSAKHSWAPR